MSDKTIFVATSSILGEYDGRPLYIHQGVTTVRAGHPLLETFGDRFEALRPMFEVDAGQEDGPEPVAAAAATQETTDGPGVAPTTPDPKAVRAWAADNGIDVPARGKIPAEIVEQFQAAQGA